MAGCAGAHLLIGWAVGVATHVPSPRCRHAVHVSEKLLNAPKTASAKCCNFGHQRHSGPIRASKALSPIITDQLRMPAQISAADPGAESVESCRACTKTLFSDRKSVV